MTRRVGLARARKTAGYSQEALAEALRVDRSTVVRWEAGDHEPLPYLRPKMARLLSVSGEELAELLRSPLSVQGGDEVPTAESDELRHVLSPGSLLLPVVIDGYSTLLPLDVSALVDRRGWASTVDSLHYAEDWTARCTRLSSYREVM